MELVGSETRLLQIALSGILRLGYHGLQGCDARLFKVDCIIRRGHFELALHQHLFLYSLQLELLLLLELRSSHCFRV